MGDMEKRRVPLAALLGLACALLGLVAQQPLLLILGLLVVVLDLAFAAAARRRARDDEALQLMREIRDRA